MRTREENDYRATRSARILKPESKYKGTNLNSDGSSGCGKEEMTVRNKVGKFLLNVSGGRKCEYG